MKNISPLYKFSLKAEGGTNSVNRKCNPLRRSCASRERNAGESATCPVRAQPSAEIVRVECAKCRQECDLSGPSATLCGDRAGRAHETQARMARVRLVRLTLCGDRACRVNEVQARVQFVRSARNPLRRWRARNAGESAICPMARATLCGDRACAGREMQARVRFVPRARNPLRRSCVSSARNAGESAICLNLSHARAIG